jgi:hypothetical protein
MMTDRAALPLSQQDYLLYYTSLQQPTLAPESTFVHHNPSLNVKS